MATTSIWKVEGSIRKVLGYAMNPQKTEQQFFVSGINCTPQSAADEMIATKELHGKTGGIVGFHGYQSFAHGEVTPEIAHRIGVEMATELWGERFEVIVTTHLDKEHIHNHIVLNSVSFADGKRFYRSEQDYHHMRSVSDRLCKQYRLSVIDNPEPGKSKHYAEWQAEKQGKDTWRNLIKRDVDEAVDKAMTDRQFFENLVNIGYEVKTGKDISVKPPGKERFVRLARNFGDDYTYEGIKNRILANKHPMLPIPKPKRHTAPNQKRIALPRGNIVGLYRHYKYLFEGYSKGDSSNKRMHFLLREDLAAFKAITAEAALLETHGIETLADLNSHRTGLHLEVKALEQERTTLRNQDRKRDPDQATDPRIAEITAQLRELRKEVKKCERIETRSKEIARKIEVIESADAQQTKEVRHGRIRTGSRTTDANDAIRK